MRNFTYRKMQVTAAAVAAGAIMTTGALAAAGTAQAAPPSQAPSARTASQAVTTHVPLSAMPQGTVTLFRDQGGTVAVTVRAFGLTPGSSHAVALVDDHGLVTGHFGLLTADAAGQASATLHSKAGHVGHGTHLIIRNGDGAGQVANEVIAQTGATGQGFGTYRLIPVEVSANGANFGVPLGIATIRYNPSARAISVTVNASGLTPGAHAAHIHVGSCAAQGPVKYMLMDYVANGRGLIINETRTVTHVTTPPPASGWYLNLHQGNGNNILDAAGNPTINFRPLLCGNIVR